jgi:hypothetical protein
MRAYVPARVWGGPAASVGPPNSWLTSSSVNLRSSGEPLGTARTGQRVLVARGEAGAGKSALLGYASEAASGFRLARVCGVESDMELAFAGLQQLCAPLLDGLERLPAPQRDAIETAFALSRGSPPDRFFMGWRCSVCLPMRRGSVRFCAWSTMRSGSMVCQRRPERLWRADCRQNPCSWSSPRGTHLSRTS